MRWRSGACLALVGMQHVLPSMGAGSSFPFRWGQPLWLTTVGDVFREVAGRRAASICAPYTQHLAG